MIKNFAKLSWHELYVLYDKNTFQIYNEMFVFFFYFNLSPIFFQGFIN